MKSLMENFVFCAVMLFEYSENVCKIHSETPPTGGVFFFILNEIFLKQAFTKYFWATASHSV